MSTILLGVIFEYLDPNKGWECDFNVYKYQLAGENSMNSLASMLTRESFYRKLNVRPEVAIVYQNAA